jgi:flagellar hook-length control protein FliK
VISPAAPAILDAAPVTPVTTPASGESAGFDAILLLQSLAATTDTLDAATFEAGDTADGLASEDGGDDDAGDDIENSLAFLANLIATTAPPGSAGDFQSGAGDGGGSDDASALPLAANDADAGFALTTEAGKADSLLALMTPEPLDKKPAAGDASQNLARAAELLAQTQRAGHTEAARPAVLTHVRDPRWADDFSARVSLAVRAGESTASLQLTPVDLGPVEVNVTVKDSQATIHFGASQAETRALIEASLPKLRELLASQGFSLMDASVSSGFTRQQQAAFASPSRGGAGDEAETSSTEARVTRQLGLLDLYA